MKQLGVHLGGSRDGLMEFGVEAAKLGIRTFQVHLSNPRRWELPDGTLLSEFLKEIRPILDSSENPNVTLVVHGPFVFSLAKSEQYSFIHKYLLECSRVMESLDLLPDDRVFIVTHVGSRPIGLGLKDVVGQLFKLCSSWQYYTAGHRSVLCLENDAGSNKGTKLGSVKFLKGLKTKLREFDRVSICWDTEHAFANGMDLSNRENVEDTLKYSSVVHLNSIPTYVTRGGHLDRHSDDLIADGQCVEDLLYVAKRCEELEIPMILERSKNIVLQDYSYIKEELR